MEPATLAVAVTATRLTKEFANGFIVDKILENRQETLTRGQTITLATDGMWQLTFSAPGAADDLTRTYWVGVPAVTATITDPAEPFEQSLLVTARSSDPTARLFGSLDGVGWTEGATITITQDAAVSFIALTPSGIASAIATRSFTKTHTVDDTATADAIHHFLAGRIDATEYVSYSQQFGFFTPFTLFLVDGDWVLDPNRPARRLPQPAPPTPPTSGPPAVVGPSSGYAPAIHNPGRTPARSPSSSKHPSSTSRSRCTTPATDPCPPADPPASPDTPNST